MSRGCFTASARGLYHLCHLRGGPHGWPFLSLSAMNGWLPAVGTTRGVSLTDTWTFWGVLLAHLPLPLPPSDGAPVRAAGLCRDASLGGIRVPTHLQRPLRQRPLSCGAGGGGPPLGPRWCLPGGQAVPPADPVPGSEGWARTLLLRLPLTQGAAGRLCYCPVDSRVPALCGPACWDGTQGTVGHSPAGVEV